LTKREALRRAIELARGMEEDGCVCVHRTAPRQFEIREYLVPFSRPEVIIHAQWAREGWYDKYKPEWVGKGGQNARQT
jgi:hypothetical protein